MAAAREKRRSPVRRLARLGLWLVAGLAGLLLLAWLALLVFLPDDKIRRLALDQVSELVRARVESGPLHIGLLSGFTLEGLRLGAPPGFSRPLLEVEKINFSYAPLQLLRGRLLVRQVVLEGPVVHLERKGGVFNLERLLAAGADVAPSSGEPAEPAGMDFTLDLRRLSIKGGSLLLLLDGVRLLLDGVRVQARLLWNRRRERRLELEMDWPAPARSNLRLGDQGAAAFTCRMGGSLHASLENARWRARIAIRLLDGRWGDGERIPALQLQAELSGTWPPPAGPVVVERLLLKERRQELLRAGGRLDPGEGWRVRYSLHSPGWAMDLLGRRLGLAVSGRLNVTDGRARGTLSGETETTARLALDDIRLAAGATVASGLGGTSRLRASWRRGSLSARLSDSAWRIDSLARPGLRLRAGKLEAQAAVEVSAGGDDTRVAVKSASVKIGCERLGLGNLVIWHPTVGLTTRDLAWPAGAGAGQLRLELVAAAGQARLADNLVQRPRLEAHLSAHAGGRGAWLPDEAVVRARLSAGRLESGPVLAEGVSMTLTGKVGWAGTFRGGLRASIRRLAGRGAAPWQLPGPLRLQSRLAAGRQRLELERSRWEIQQLGTVGVSGTWSIPSGDLNLDWRGRLQAGSLVDGWRPLGRLAPARVSGQLRLDGNLRGKLSPAAAVPLRAGVTGTVQPVDVSYQDRQISSDGINGSLQLSWPRLTERRFSILGKLLLRRVQTASFTAARVGVELRLEGSPAQVGARLSSRVGRLWFAKLARQPWRQVELELAGRLLAGKEGRLRRLFLRLPAAGLVLEGEGQALLSDTATWPPRFSFSGSLGVRLDSKRPVSWPGGVRLRGRGRAQLGVRSPGRGQVNLSGDFEFSDLDVTAPGFSARRLVGHLQVRQAVQLQRGGVSLQGEKRLRRAVVRPRSAYDQVLGPLRAPASGVWADAVLLGSLRLEHPRAEIELDQGLLRVGGLRLGLLGGDVAAELGLVLAPADRRSLGMWLEASDIDLGRLTALAGEDSRVGGNMRLQARADRHELNAAVHLTSIGRGALRALLRSLDPERKNPSLARLRDLLERYQVAPRAASLQLRRGLLDLVIDLDLGPAARTMAHLIHGFEGQTFRLPALPVGPWLNSVLARLRRAEETPPGK